MNELVRGLTNLRSLRAAVRELTLEQAENALEKLQTAI
ncbi:TPA: DNA-binding protein H-NS-like protein, partial [Haemophilus influenzae]